MANIPALANGETLYGTTAQAGAAPYGAHCTAVRISGGMVLRNKAGVELATWSVQSGYSVQYGEADADTVPYINRFIAGWGKVETYWRADKALPFAERLRLTGPGAPRAAKPAKAFIGTTEADVKPAKPSASPVVDSMPAIGAHTLPRDPEPVAEPVAPTPVTPVARTARSTEGIPPVAPAVKAKHRSIGGVPHVTLGKVTILESDFNTLEDAWATRASGGLASVLITGPSGTAKTLVVEAFAAYKGVPFIVADGGLVRTADDWFGGLRQDQLTGRWDYILSPWGQALEAGTECIVLLDECNRSETPQALNAGLGLLGPLKRTYVSDAQRNFNLPDGMLVVATANLGAEYVATQAVDAAVRQRFSSGGGIRMDYPTEQVETFILTDVVKGLDEGLAGRLSRMAQQQRPLKDDLSQFPSGTGISPRMLVDIASRHVNRGRDIRECILGCFASQFDVQDMVALDVIVDQHFPADANATLEVDTSAITED